MAPVAMTTAHNRKRGLHWAETQEAALSAGQHCQPVKNKTGQKDLMRTISPKKEEKKKAKKTNKAKQPEDRGWLGSKDPVFSLPHNVG